MTVPRRTIPILPNPDEPVKIDKALLAPRLEYNKRTAKVARYFARTQNGAYGAPISMQAALTDRCFNRCIMCGHPYRAPREISVERWLGFISEHSLQVESVCYSGGDPMAYRNFNQVMDWHIVTGVAFGATITGHVPPYIDLSLLRRAQWVRVSLDAVTPAVYEVVRGHVAVEKVIDGIDRMLFAGVPVALGVTVHKHNEADIPNVLAFAASRGITDIDVRPVYPDSVLEEPPIERNIMPFQHCHASLYQLYIDADGSVYPCCITAGDTKDGPTAYSLGNIDEDWSLVWSRVVEHATKDASQLPDVCRTCCVQRLSEINHICDQLADQTPKSFF